MIASAFLGLQEFFDNSLVKFGLLPLCGFLFSQLLGYVVNRRRNKIFSSILGIEEVNYQEIEKVLEKQVPTGKAEDDNIDLITAKLSKVRDKCNNRVLVLSGFSDVGKISQLYKAYRQLVEKDVFIKRKIYLVDTSAPWSEIAVNVKEFIVKNGIVDSWWSNRQYILVFDFNQAVSPIAAREIIDNVTNLRKKISSKNILFVIKCICGGALTTEANVYEHCEIMKLEKEESKSFFEEYRKNLERKGGKDRTQWESLNQRQCIDIADGRVGRIVSIFENFERRKELLGEMAERACRARLVAWQNETNASSSDVESLLAFLYFVALFSRVLNVKVSFDLRVLAEVLLPKDRPALRFSALKNILRGAFCLDGVNFSNVSSKDFVSADKTLWTVYVSLRGRVGTFDFVDEIERMKAMLLGSRELKCLINELIAARFDMNVDYELLLAGGSPDPAEAVMAVLMKNEFFTAYAQIARFVAMRLWNQIGLATNSAIKDCCDKMLADVEEHIPDIREKVFVELAPLYVAYGQSPIYWWKYDWSARCFRDADVVSSALAIAYLTIAALLYNYEWKDRDRFNVLVSYLKRAAKHYAPLCPPDVCRLLRRVVNVAYRLKTYDEAANRQVLEKRVIRSIRSVVDAFAAKDLPDSRLEVMLSTLLAEVRFIEGASIIGTYGEDYKYLCAGYVKCASKFEVFSKSFVSRTKTILEAYCAHNAQMEGHQTHGLLNAITLLSKQCVWGEFDSPELLRCSLWIEVGECSENKDTRRAIELAEMALKTGRWTNRHYQACTLRHLATIYSLFKDDKGCREGFISSFRNLISNVQSYKEYDCGLIVCELYKAIKRLFENHCLEDLPENEEFKNELLEFVRKDDEVIRSLMKTIAVRNAWLLALSSTADSNCHKDDDDILMAAKVIFSDWNLEPRGLHRNGDRLKKWFCRLFTSFYDIKPRIGYRELGFFLVTYKFGMHYSNMLLKFEHGYQPELVGDVRLFYALGAYYLFDEYHTEDYVKRLRPLIERIIDSPCVDALDYLINVRLTDEISLYEKGETSLGEFIEIFRSGEGWDEKKVDKVLLDNLWAINSLLASNWTATHFSDQLRDKIKELVKLFYRKYPSYFVDTYKKVCDSEANAVVSAKEAKAAYVNEVIGRLNNTKGVDGNKLLKADLFPNILIDSHFVDFAVSNDIHAVLVSVCGDYDDAEVIMRDIVAVRDSLIEQEPNATAECVIVLVGKNNSLKMVPAGVKIIEQDEISTGTYVIVDYILDRFA